MLGWLQLTHSKTRFIVAASGVGLAVILVFMQLGFMAILFESTTTIHQQFDTDLVVISVDAEGIVPNSGSFSRHRLVQAAGQEGVADFADIYIATLNWTKPSDGTVGQITVFGVPTDARVFARVELQAQLPGLRMPGTFLIDEGARGEYADFFAQIVAAKRPTAKLGSETATAIGTFRFGATLGIDAMAIVSRETFLQLVPSRQPGVINMGLLHLAPGQDPNAIVDRI